MKKKSSVKMNLFYNTLYQILLVITPLITSPYVSRTLGSDGLGVFSYTYSMANCFALVGMLGVTNYGNRTIASVQNDRTKRSEAFWNIYTLQAITTVVLLIAYFIFIFDISPIEDRNIFLIQSLTVLCSMCDINWYFFGVEKFKLTVTRNIVIKIVNVVLIFLFVHNAKDTSIYTLIIVGSLLLSNLVVWPFLRQEVDFVKPSFDKIKPHLNQTFVLFIPVIAITLYKRMDKIMLGMLSTMSQTGIYENTEKIINIPNSLIAALGTVMLPRMSYLFANGDKKAASKYITISMEFICMVSSVLLFGIAGIAKEFAPWFFGDEFQSVGPLLIAMTPTIFFVSWANVIRTQYLIPLHHDKIYVSSVWIGAAVNLIINILLIPSLGAMGTVIGTVCAEGYVAIYQTMCVRKELPVLTYIKNGVYYIFAGVVMFFSIRLIGNGEKASVKVLALEVLFGGCVFIALCIPYILKKHRKEVKLLIDGIGRKLHHGIKL